MEALFWKGLLPSNLFYKNAKKVNGVGPTRVANCLDKPGMKRLQPEDEKHARAARPAKASHIVQPNQLPCGRELSGVWMPATGESSWP